MNKITLSVDNKNLEAVLTILQNLKAGLITDIETNSKVSKSIPKQYQPKINKISNEEEAAAAASNGKYINPAAYKQRLRNAK